MWVENDKILWITKQNDSINLQYDSSYQMIIK